MKDGKGIGIIGTGRSLPEQRVSNEAIAGRLGVTSEWIENRTGIRFRHYAREHESASGFAAQAAKQALKNSKVKPENLDLIIGCTSSRDYIFPPLAVKLQHLLAAKNAGAFDLTAGAAGFQMALDLAASHLKCKNAATSVLIVGSALLSRYLNWKDAKSAVIFGDGAGAVVLSRVPAKYGLLTSEMLCDGSVYDTFRLRGGGSSYPLSLPAEEETHFIEMEGLQVAHHFLKYQPQVIQRSLKSAGLTIKEIDLFIFHQANLRLIHALMNKMGIPRSKTFTNVERVGNTADASVVIALSEAVEQKRIRRNHLVVIAGAGPGGIYSSSVVRWY